MAQAGMYVPCKRLELGLYTSIYTRIAGGDDFTKGLSSFTVEMLEIKSILTRANKGMFVIGDEICRVTEYVSVQFSSCKYNLKVV